MKNLTRTLYSIGAACTLLALAPVDASSQTVRVLGQSLVDLAGPGEVIYHKTDFSDSDCTTQVTAKVDKGDPVVTRVDFKIDRSCDSSGQAQITFICLEISAIFSCNVDYDNPADLTEAEVGENTNIASVPELEDLLLDAADATDAQFPMLGNPTIDLLVEILTDAGDGGPTPTECPPFC